MNRNAHRRTARGLMAAGLVLAPLAAKAALPVLPFDAMFTLYVSGFPVGEASLSLEDLGGCEYAMSSRLEATGLAKLIYSDVVEEHARGRFNDAGVPLPVTYRHHQSGGKREHEVAAEFRWEDMSALARHDDRERSIKLWRRVVDPLSLFALAMSDLKNGIEASQYNLVHKAYRRSYKVSHQGAEVLSTPLGEIATVRVTRQRHGSTRATTLWFATELDYLPVQVVQTRDGDEYLKMRISSLRR